MKEAIHDKAKKGALDAIASVRPWTRALWQLGVALLLVSGLLNLEGTRVLRAAGPEIAGEWEVFLVSRGVPSIALLAVVPMLLVIIAFGTQLALVTARRGRVVWTALFASASAALAIALSTGRKARALELRVPFVVAVVALTAVLAWLLLPRLFEATRRRPAIAILLGLLAAMLSSELDRRVLPRLYPPFHATLVVATVVGVVLMAAGVVGEVLASAGRAARRGRGIAVHAPVLLDLTAACGFYLASVAMWRVPEAGRDLARYDNARRIVDERSLTLGRAAALAATRWPPAPLDESGSEIDPLAENAPLAIALEAKGRDLLLVTIDALRADHVGAYGYPRATTPAIDRLAAEGVVFEHAYTPTPHTSYAVSSLMTGKYLRPILALESVASAPRRPDETWAGLMRAYGFRTAAFYPPAIFFVDAERFSDLKNRGLDFEYAKIEFAAPDLRAAQVSSYLQSAPKDKPLFLWVHLFEPHEPYVAHPQHPFGDAEIDRYDSEIAAADAGLGAIVAAMRARRPDAIVIVSADHGEAFGEHGARYHGTTVYEEQVRVPLVISAPGLVAHRRVARPVQLVDLLPTILSAYAIPKPPRVRGRDLGPLLAMKPPSEGEGIAFAEVEDAAMIARGDKRLVCNRKLAFCALYDVSQDPLERQAIYNDDAKVLELRKAMAGVIAASAKLEGFGGGGPQGWPDALRRAFAGDTDAALEVAPLLDDVDVAFRRRAAEALARLARKETAPHVTRALGTEQDAACRKWLVIARVRIEASSSKVVSDLGALVPAIGGDDRELSRWASLALGEAVRIGAAAPPGPAFALAGGTIVEWLPSARSDGELTRVLLDALVALRTPSTSKKATPFLLAALDDVRLRQHAARALGSLGDEAAGPALEKRLANERHVDARAAEAIALARVGFPERALPLLVRWLGVPEPAPGGGDALLDVAKGTAPGWLARAATPMHTLRASLLVPPGKAHRLLVIGPTSKSLTKLTLDGSWYYAHETPAGYVFELEGKLATSIGERIVFDVNSDQRIRAFALIPRVADLPPPKPDRSVKDDEGAPD